MAADNDGDDKLTWNVIILRADKAEPSAVMAFEAAQWMTRDEEIVEQVEEEALYMLVNSCNPLRLLQADWQAQTIDLAEMPMDTPEDVCAAMQVVESRRAALRDSDASRLWLVRMTLLKDNAIAAIASVLGEPAPPPEPVVRMMGAASGRAPARRELPPLGPYKIQSFQRHGDTVVLSWRGGQLTGALAETDD